MIIILIIILKWLLFYRKLFTVKVPIFEYLLSYMQLLYIIQTIYTLPIQIDRLITKIGAFYPKDIIILFYQDW